MDRSQGTLAISTGLAGLAAVVGIALASPAAAVQSGDLVLSAEVNGRDVSEVDANEPLRLSPESGADIKVVVRNDGTEDLEVDSVRLESRVLGLAFVTYTTRVDMVVAPGEQEERQFLVDTSDLAGQATGLLPGTVSLWSSGELLAEEDLAVDVRGAVTSLYGVFGIAVAVTTVLLLVAALYRLATHQLSGNRWLRATRFAVPAAGLGLTLTFTLSALRLLMPAPSSSLGFVLAGTAVGLVFGYLTPDPRVADRSADDAALLAELLARRDGELPAAERPALEPAADEPLAAERPAVEAQRVAELPRRQAPTTVVPHLPAQHVPAAEHLPAEQAPSSRRDDAQLPQLER